MTKDEAVALGFNPLPHFTITGALIYDLGRDRHLSLGCVGEANEMIWICSSDHKDPKKITDLICIHNYDYDGLLTEEKLKAILTALTWPKNTVKNGL